MAEKFLNDAEAKIEQLGSKDQPEWDTFVVQDWLTCLIVLDQARELIRPGAPAGKIAAGNP